MTRVCVCLSAFVLIVGCGAAAHNPGPARDQQGDNSKSHQDAVHRDGAAPGDGDREFAWFNSLPNGGIHYPSVRQLMFYKEPKAFTVYVNGPAADTKQIDFKNMQGGTLKVSPRMKVLLTCPDNPDAFTIKAEPGTTDVQDVPMGGITRWVWYVTPQLTGQNQKLVVRAWVIYPGKPPVEQELFPSYTATVNVHVPGVGEALKRLVELDPDYWLHYGLPGGAGFAAFVAFLKWLWSLRKKKAPSTAEKQETTT